MIVFIFLIILEKKLNNRNPSLSANHHTHHIDNKYILLLLQREFLPLFLPSNSLDLIRAPVLHRASGVQTQNNPAVKAGFLAVGESLSHQ
ncbi:MAG TPA: hypothetical protein VMV97_11130 [Sulfuriferula sp.]|nr:hypothetical protein [Sulfuriferula sp.]